MKTLSLWESMMSKLHSEYANDKVDFGRYQGTKLKDVPTSYLKWFIVNGTDRFLAEVFALELGRRDKSFR
ncbi:MAG: putative quorum-sensing-regulated virulence factor [Candidatus Planktophila sp.]